MATPYIGQIKLVAFNFAPKGWAFCDVQILPLSQNTALFSLLGTTYGGDGKSNFALPNMQRGLTSKRESFLPLPLLFLLFYEVNSKVRSKKLIFISNL